MSMKERPTGKYMSVDSENLHAYSSALLQARAYRVLHTTLTKTLVRFGITIAQWKLLGLLYDYGVLTLVELSWLLSVEPPLVTGLIGKLEKKQLVRRMVHPQDKRAKIITATKKGRVLILEIEPFVKKSMGKLLQGISRGELIVYIRVLKTIVANADDVNIL